jgi:CelD/BcsL family acetyltransferase involved in cellulose biosynthesis
MYSIKICRVTEEEFSGMRNHWNALLDRSITNEIFLSWEWMHTWWEVFKGGDKELYILLGKDADDKTIGIAPLYIHSVNESSLRAKKIVRLCSSLETCPDHLDFISDQDSGLQFPKAVFEYLKANGREWDELNLNGLKENGAVKNYLTSVDPVRLCLLVDCIPDSHCPYLSINQGYGDYLKSFSGKKRYNFLRYRRILMDTEKAEYRMVQCAENLKDSINELFVLHAERAGRKGIKSSFSGEHTYLFHKNLVTLLLENDKVILASLYKDALPLAAVYCIRHNKKYYYYQNGISLDGEKKRAGTILLSMILEKAFAEECREFDFLRGEEAYKYLWTETSRQNYSFIIRKNNLAGAISHIASVFLRKMRAQMVRLRESLHEPRRCVS